MNTSDIDKKQDKVNSYISSQFDNGLHQEVQKLLDMRVRYGYNPLNDLISLAATAIEDKGNHNPKSFIKRFASFFDFEPLGLPDKALVQESINCLSDNPTLALQAQIGKIWKIGL